MTTPPKDRPHSHSDFGFRHLNFSGPCLRSSPFSPLATSDQQLATRCSAFTLVELLVVIGIIAILVGVLLPVIAHVRIAAYTADTQNEMSQISNACNAYYSTYHAYPGPLSNFETQWGGGNPPSGTNNGTIPENGNTPTVQYLYAAGAYSTSPFSPAWCVTASENLVLGLMGGLRVNPNVAAPYNIAFAPSEVGLGPMSLNALNPSRQQPFFPAGSTYLMWCQQPQGGGSVYQTTTYNPNDNIVDFTDAATHQATDSPIPEFVDRFPTPGPLPILYMRARVGAKGVVSDGSFAVAGAVAQYQYDIRDIVNYTNPAANTNATPSPGCTIAAIGLPTGFVHDLSALFASGGTINTTNPPTSASGIAPIIKAGNSIPSPGGTPAPTSNAYQDGFPYFCNKSIQSTNPADLNYGGRPRAVDQFILISAGPDGIYGTADDITSFGDVSQ
jgi:prepilin-type N-terminal cleavage/methylation domain-containing protein